MQGLAVLNELNTKILFLQRPRNHREMQKLTFGHRSSVSYITINKRDRLLRESTFNLSSVKELFAPVGYSSIVYLSNQASLSQYLVNLLHL